VDASPALEPTGFAVADSAALGVADGAASEIGQAPGLFDALPAAGAGSADPAEAAANVASQSAPEVPPDRDPGERHESHNA
jgi:hypothetical protein